MKGENNLEKNRKKNSIPQEKFRISNSRAMGVISLIALLFVFQTVSFIVHKVRELSGGPAAAVEAADAPLRFRFNPNTIPLDSLQLLGFTRRQAESVLRYREKGGRFRRVEDFAKLYVVDSNLYRSLAGYIHLPDRDRAENSRQGAGTRGDVRSAAARSGGGGPGGAAPADSRRRGTAGDSRTEYRRFPEMPGRPAAGEPAVGDTGRSAAGKTIGKLPENGGSVYGKRVRREVCNLNFADSSDLVRLWGIGPYFARKILRYRERLGGSFADVRQLLEIEGFGEERFEKIARQVEVNRMDIVHFSLRRSDPKFLEGHPYIGVYAARGIRIYLEMPGADTSGTEREFLGRLVREGVISQENAGCLAPYL